MKDLREKAMAATPGPWTTARGDGDMDMRARFLTRYSVLVAANGDCELHPVADCSCNHTCRTPDEQEDNAAFIAAANPSAIEALYVRIEALQLIAQKLTLATDEGDDKAQGTHYIDKQGVIRCKGSFLELIEKSRAALSTSLGD